MSLPSERNSLEGGIPEENYNIMDFTKFQARAFVLLSACFLLLFFSSGGSTTPSAAIAVPSYVYPCFDLTPECAWFVFENGATIVVINPDSGPGTAPISSFTTLVSLLKEGTTVTTVLGYVLTGYGNRNPSLVLSEIDTYHQFYNISGIFLDEGSTFCDSTNLTNYKSYDDRVKTNWGSSGFTALNWGTTGSQCYLQETKIDTYCTFEGSYATYISPTGYPTNPEWIITYNASSFWHIVYSTPTNETSVEEGVSLAEMRHAGYYYFTDAIYLGESTPYNNPYNVSPSPTVWNAEKSLPTAEVWHIDGAIPQIISQTEYG